MDAARQAKLQIHKSRQGRVTVLRFAGTLDETFDGGRVSQGLDGFVVVSLAEVKRITSFGIRQWLDFVTKLSTHCSGVYFIECSPRMVDQFNMVSNFGGKGTILSFYAPFRCGNCGAESIKLMQVDQSREAIASGQITGETCSKDGHQLQFDDDPDTFFAYLRGQPEANLDPAVAAILASRSGYAVSEGMSRVRIEKRVRERYTFISFSGDIGADLPADKIAEGLEGDVVFDLAGVGQIKEDGVASWRLLLQTVAPITERILLVGCPPSLLELISRQQDVLQKGQVLSLYLPYACQSCAITSHFEIDVARQYDSLRLATAPELVCPECGRATQCVATVEMLKALTEIPPPASDLKTEKLLKWAREVVEPAAPTPTLSAAPALSGQRRGFSLMMLVGGASMVAAAVAIYLAINRTGPGEFAEKPVMTEASHPKPPEWRDQNFSVSGDQVLVAGSSAFVADKEDGFKHARDAALEVLSYQLAAAIQDPLWVEHVGSQFQSFRSKALGDLEKALVSGETEAIRRSRKLVREGAERVSLALQTTAGDLVQPEPTNFYWEKVRIGREFRYQVWSLYRVSKVSFKRLVDYYTTRGDALSTSVVPYFPGMSWRYEQQSGAAVVIGMKADSPLKYIGVMPGDILVSAQDRTIKDSRSFERVMVEEYAELERSGGAMTIRIRRGDGPLVDHRLQVVQRVAQPVRQYNGGGGRGSGSGRSRGDDQPTRRQPAANIWDDNPFE